jgi:transposase
VVKLAKKLSAYHLDILNKNTKPIGLLRTSYREGGKVKHKTLCSFPGQSLEQLRLLQAALQNRVMYKQDFKIIDSREYGASFACVELIKALGLHKMIYSRSGEEWVKSCLAMIAGRLVYAGSKLSLSHCGSYSSLWEVCGVDGDVDVDTHCYDAMDRLFERQDAIQQSLAKKHLSDGTLVLYDITSCYMEGEYEESDLVEYGYNRDKKRGHEQIVISLLCSKDGCPVAVEVFPGNTKDETTVMNKIEEIHKKYGIENIVFVGDRGMVTQAKFEKMDHSTTKVISALTHNNIQELCDKKTIQISMFDEENIVEVIDGDMRYCLCKNPVMAAKETATRLALLSKTTEELDKIIKCTKKTKYSKEMRAGKAVDKFKMGKFIIFNGAGDNLTYTVNQEKIDQESSLDGCYIIYTDVSDELMSAYETVKNYKSLVRVEQTFRSMKTVHLELRPVYHNTDDRIKCHVFICMLAYYVMWHMIHMLQPLFDSDGVGTNRKCTFNYIIKTLEGIRKETLEIEGIRTFVTTTPTIEQSYILKLLDVIL